MMIQLDRIHHSRSGALIAGGSTLGLSLLGYAIALFPSSTAQTEAADLAAHGAFPATVCLAVKRRTEANFITAGISDAPDSIATQNYRCARENLPSLEKRALRS